MNRKLFTPLAILAFLLGGSQFAAGFSINGGSDYALLFEGGGGNTLQITNVTVNGNIGVGNTGIVHDSGPSTINGRLDFSAANTGQFTSSNGGNVGPTSVNYNVAAVTTALNNLNTLNTTLGAESGTNVNIANSTTINASAGTFHGTDSVFTVTGFNTTNGDTLTINGDGVHDVVLNFTSSVNFNNQVKLVGITSDHVLYNFVGGANLTGGPTLQINDNASSSASNLVQGVFLDPNGAISVTNANVLGRVFGGDTHDFQYVSGSNIHVPMVPDSGSAVALLGIALAGIEAARRLVKQGYKR
jgi:hypothetical protein